MGTQEDIKKLQEQSKTILTLLKNPPKNAQTVLYLVETIQKLENANFDLSNKWNTVVAYLQNKKLVEEYNDWVTQLEAIENPQMKQLFMLQPIGEPREKETPTAPELCKHTNPHREGLECSDIIAHEGGIHTGTDSDGMVFQWTDEKDLGEIEEKNMPIAPTNMESLREELNMCLKERLGAEEVYKEVSEKLGMKPEDAYTEDQLGKVVAVMRTLPYINAPKTPEQDVFQKLAYLMETREGAKEKREEVLKNLGIRKDKAYSETEASAMCEVLEKLPIIQYPEEPEEEPEEEPPKDVPDF